MNENNNLNIERKEVTEIKNASQKQIDLKKVLKPAIAVFLGALSIAGIKKIAKDISNQEDKVAEFSGEVSLQLDSLENEGGTNFTITNGLISANESVSLPSVDGETYIEEENIMKTEDYNIPTANELNQALRNNYFYDAGDIYVLKNNDLNAFMLTENTNPYDNWQLVGKLDDEICDKLININEPREPEVLNIWQLEQKDEEGNWLPMTDIAYNEKEPIVTNENERWVKIGQEYMATLQTNFYNLNVYKPLDIDGSIIIADDIDASKIYPDIKIKNINDLHLVPSTVVVHNNEVGRSK